MSSTAHDDQYTTAPEPLRQPYDTVAILKRNVADLEVALRTQTEHAEAAEQELAKLRKQEPIKYLYRVTDCFGHDVLRDDPKGATILETIPLFAAPVTAPAVPTHVIPEGDDFNGTTPHMIRCIESLVSMNDRGALVPHGLCGHSRTLLLASANRLRQQQAPAVPADVEKLMQILSESARPDVPVGRLECPDEWSEEHKQTFSRWVHEEMQNNARRSIIKRARALLQSAEVKS